MTVPWGLSLALGALVLVFVIYIIGAGVFAAADPKFADHHDKEFGVLAYQILVAAVIFTSFWLILRRFGGDIAILGYRFPGWKVLALAALSVVAILIAAGILVEVFNALFPATHIHGNAKGLLPKRRSWLEATGVIIWAVIEAPLTEETLFRGILFQGLRQFFIRWLPYQGAVAMGAIASGTLFGLAHFEPHTLPVLIFLGVVLAYIFQLSRSIYASSLVHALINAVGVAFAVLHS